MMFSLATVPVGKLAIVAVLLVPALAAAVTLVAIVGIVIGIAATGAVGWGLTRASVAIFGRSDEVWR
jgi:hypothetical protein